MKIRQIMIDQINVLPNTQFVENSLCRIHGMSNDIFTKNSIFDK